MQGYTGSLDLLSITIIKKSAFMPCGLESSSSLILDIVKCSLSISTIIIFSSWDHSVRIAQDILSPMKVSVWMYVQLAILLPLKKYAWLVAMVNIGMEQHAKNNVHNLKSLTEQPMIVNVLEGYIGMAKNVYHAMQGKFSTNKRIFVNVGLDWDGMDIHVLRNHNAIMENNGISLLIHVNAP